MEIRDLIVTPIYIVLVYVVAYVVRPYVCDRFNYRYFFPALTVKIVGAIALGFIYQFYYQGGDTFNYHTRGSRIIWETFVNDPATGLQMIFLPLRWLNTGTVYNTLSHIPFHGDPASYFIVRVAAFIDLFTFSAYSATAVVFAVMSFAGSWMMFLAFYKVYPSLMSWLAVAVFFIPSVFFWGSGIMKDTIVMTALGASVFLFQNTFIYRSRRWMISFTLLLVAFGVIYLAKKYVLICFLPAALLWAYLNHLFAIRSMALRLLIFPLVLTLLVFTGYYAIVKVGEGDAKYSLDKLAVTAQVTAYDIGFYTGRDAGSGYNLGVLDGTMVGTMKLAPQAINASLFRPYVWEAKNVLMLMAAGESLIILLLTVFILIRTPISSLRAFREPDVLFCMAFAITFAFAVGVSTFNFGTLMRYKIPMLPFYLIGLLLMRNYAVRGNKSVAPNTSGSLIESA
jgi:hypothetical protein